VAAGVVGGASAAAATDSPRQDGFAAARAATATFHDISVAKAAGFGELKDAAGIACIDNAAGGMGIHYVNGGRIDGVLDPAAPEVLVYEPQPDGSMRLGALEYVIFASAWTGEGPPQLYGHEFHYMPGQDEPHPNRYGLPAFWELHAWVWNHNARGVFNDWNPAVTCP
jgi:hypothetical protein